MLILAFLYLLLLSTVCSAELELEYRPRRHRGGRSHPQLSNAHTSLQKQRVVNGSECIEAKPSIIKAPKKNVWRQLSPNETSAIEHWLHQQKDLDLKRGYSYSTHGNVLLGLELQIPNKTDVLSYLDGEGKEPARYARVELNLNSKYASTYNDILVGPLPISSATTWQPLTYPYTRKTGSIRDLYFKEEIWYKHLDKALHAVRNITKNLWPGPGVRPEGGDGMSFREPRLRRLPTTDLRDRE